MCNAINKRTDWPSCFIAGTACGGAEQSNHPPVQSPSSLGVDGNATWDIGFPAGGDLYTDNAGGHGKKNVVEKYVATLKDDYNVIICHQCPCSPATNMLDLGVWMALQNVVEKLHFRKRTEVEALCRTVEAAWKVLEPIKLEIVYA